MAYSWEQFKSAATQMAKQENFPVALLLGQAALETGHGTSWLAQNKNNYFGYGATDNNHGSGFNSPEDSIKAYIDLIKTSPQFSGAWQQYLKDKNTGNLLKNLAPTYAADKDYVSKVLGTPEWKENGGGTVQGYATTKYLSDGTPYTVDRTMNTQQSGPMVTQQETTKPGDLVPVLNAQSNKYTGLAPAKPEQYASKVEADLSKVQSKMPPWLKAVQAIFPAGTVGGQETTLAPQSSMPMQSTPGQSVNTYGGSAMQGYTVQPGDTLWSIAQKYLGDGNQWGKLLGYTGSPNQLPVGTRINLPQPPSAPQQPQQPQNQTHVHVYLPPGQMQSQQPMQSQAPQMAMAGNATSNGPQSYNTPLPPPPPKQLSTNYQGAFNNYG